MIFVTGGTGLVGAHLLYSLVNSGREVTALKRNTANPEQTLKIFSYYSSRYEELFKRIRWAEGDVQDYFTLEDMLDGVEEVYHCAAMVSFNTSVRRKMLTNNVEGTANMVDAALYNGVKKFCHISSIASLGRTGNGFPVTEETSWIPSKKHSGYSESKFYSETVVWRGIEEGLNAVIVNPSLILGPGNWDNGSPKLFKAVNDGLQFYTKGVTGYVDVRDVVRAVILLMDDANFENCKNQRYLLNSENKSFQEIFSAIADELNKKRPRFYASGLVLGLAWRAAALGTIFTGRPPSITRDAVANSNRKYNFDGSKIVREVKDFSYRSVSESIKEISAIFRTDQKIADR